MIKVDLQIQTNFSDGRNSMEEVMQMAKNAGLNLVAITDHDTVRGIPVALKLAKDLDIQCVPGIELSVTENGKLLHLLGYNIDYINPEFLESLQLQLGLRKQFFISFVPILNERLKSKDFAVLDQSLYQQKDEAYFCVPGLVRFMKESGVISDTEEGFSLVVGMPKFNFSFSIETGIKLIHDAGGVAVFSHPLAPQISLKNFSKEKEEWKKIIKTYKNYGLDGIELSHTGHSEEENTFLAEWAHELSLGVTYGSDWHGTIEQTGESIKKYLPYYTTEFKGVEINEKDYLDLTDFLMIK